MKRVENVDQYLDKHPERRQELEKLRGLLLQLEYEECIKWGMPTYTIGGKNVVGIGSFKNWSCLWFHQGAFLKDSAGVLENAQEGKTKGMRQWRFSRAEDIEPKLVTAYLAEAIENQRAGKEIKASRPSKKLNPIPPLLKKYFEENPEKRKKFETYSISQKNEFCNYIIEAKRVKTKQDRVVKIAELLERGEKLSALWK